MVIVGFVPKAALSKMNGWWIGMEGQWLRLKACWFGRVGGLGLRGVRSGARSGGLGVRVMYWVSRVVD